MLYFSKSFTYNFTFTTYDGAKHELKQGGYSAYGLGSYKRVKAEFEPVAEPMYNIVLRKIYERLLDRIESGRTANICGLKITKDKLSFEKRKQTIEITKDNFGYAGIHDLPMSKSAQIFLKGEKKPCFRASLNEPNARLIVPLVNALFAPGS